MPGTELTEKQILQLRKNLDKIYKLRNEILDLADEPRNVTVLKNKIAEVLLALESIAGHASPRNEELESYMTEANLRFVGIGIESSPWSVIEREIELFCKYINSIVFDFTSNGVKIITRKALKAN